MNRINSIKNAISIAAAIVLALMCMGISASANYTPSAYTPAYKFCHHDETAMETRYYFDGDSETVIESVTVHDDGGVEVHIGTFHGIADATLIDGVWYFSQNSGEFNSNTARGELVEEFNYLLTAIF